MISGKVTSRLEAMIPLTIHGPAGQTQDIEARIDTGFTGALSMEPAIIASLGLVWRSKTRATLANGGVVPMDTYHAIVLWDGNVRNIIIAAAATNPLLGTSLLARHELRVEMIPGGRVTIEALP